MEILYLSRADVESLHLSMKEVLQAVAEGFRLKGLSKTEMPPKLGIHPRKDCFIHAMPAHIEGLESAGLKWVSGYPSNVAKGLPYITGLLILNDPETGIPIAVMDCSWITAMRTGTNGGVSAKYLARKGSSVVGIVGCGVQARTSLLALREVLGGLAAVQCYDLYPKAAEKFIAEMTAAAPGLRSGPCRSAREAAAGADVVVTAIPIVTHPAPDLDAGMLKAGGLAVSLDYDSAWTGAAPSAGGPADSRSRARTSPALFRACPFPTPPELRPRGLGRRPIIARAPMARKRSAPAPPRMH